MEARTVRPWEMRLAEAMQELQRDPSKRTLLEIGGLKAKALAAEIADWRALADTPVAPQPAPLTNQLIAACNYIDTLGGDSKAYRQAVVAQPAQQVEAVGQVPVYWSVTYCGEHTGNIKRSAKQAQALVDRLDRDYKDEAGLRAVVPLYTVPQPEAQQAGDVALKAARYDWLRTSSVGQWTHPIVVEQLRDKKFNRINYIGPLSGCALDDAIDAAMAKEKA
jgi:hypothetical protein